MADETFEAALRLVLQDELTKALKNTRAKSDAAAKGTAKGWTKAFAKMRKGMSKAQKDIQKGQQQIRSGLTTVAAGVGIAAPLALAAKSAAGFQDQMAEVATLTKKSAKEITAEFGPIVNATRTTFGKEAQGTIKALYDGFSAGVPKTKAAADAYLKAVGEMALGGKTDMTSAADAITTVKNAWAFEGLSFKQITDQTFAGVQAGKTTITELSASMGQAASTVAGARIKYQEFIGATAALTASGVKTPQAMTQIAASIAAIQKPSSEAVKWYRKIGAEITPLTFKNRGYAGTIDYIKGKVDAYTTSEDERAEIFNKLISSVEAGRAVFALAGDQNAVFKQSVDDAAKSQDLMGEAADKMREGPMFKYKQAVQETKIAWEAFGTVTAPIFSDLLETMSPLIKDITEWTRENRDLVKTLATAALWISALTVAFGVLKTVMGVATVIKGVTTALWSMNAAILANPFVLIAAAVIVAIGLVAGGLYMLITRTDEVGMFFQLMGLDISKVFNEIQLTIFNTLDAISKKVAPLTGIIKQFTGVDLSVNWTSNIDEQKQDLADIENQSNEILKMQNAIQTRREELEAKNKGKGAGGGGIDTMNLGGITNNLVLPAGVPISQMDIDKLGIQMEKKTIEAMNKAKKQKNREKVD